MEPSREDLLAEITRLRAQARRDTDAVNDAEEQTRVYRRLVLRLVKERDDALLEVERLGMRLAAVLPEE